jgi:hypothetical protein
MNPSESPEVTVQALLALRKENDAVRLITERLRVKEMGPADHIRTKHEVKAFIESGDITVGKALLKSAHTRWEASQSQNVTEQMKQHREQRMSH